MFEFKTTLCSFNPSERDRFMRKQLSLCAAFALVIAAGPARADRTQVFSIQGAECSSVQTEMGPYFKKAGVKKWTYDPDRFEFTITVADKIKDDDIVKLFEEQGCFRAIPGAGQGLLTSEYKPEPYPDGADMKVVTEKGDAVGKLEDLRVEGKYTVLDFYADWCGPCRLVDAQLREIVGARNDIAVRKLNIVGFESPLARELGRKLKALPYVIVFDPEGKKTELIGNNPEKLSEALGAPTE